MAHTGAARAAVEALTRELAASWASAASSVVAAAIGRFDTESLRKYPENVWRGAARTVPLQRLGTMHEFAWLVALLASPARAARFSGSVVTLDGAADNWTGRGRRRRWPTTPARSRPRSGSAPPRAARDRPRPEVPLARLRAKCSGCTGAFQASRAGSIPVARSRKSTTGSGAVW